MVASSGSTRSPLLPDAPTMAEAGIHVNTPRPLAPQALAAARQAEFRQYAALAKASGHVPE